MKPKTTPLLWALVAKDDYRRRDVVTLLNNWQGEVDRARKWVPARSIAQIVGVRV